MKKIFFVMFLVLMAMAVFAGNTTISTQISPTAKALLTSGSGALVSVYAVQDITTRVDDVYLYDAPNTWTARTEANILIKMICEAGQGWRCLYEGKVFPVAGLGEAKYQGIAFSSGIVAEASTSTINAILGIR